MSQNKQIKKLYKDHIFKIPEIKEITNKIDQTEVFFITYPDSFYIKKEKPLKTLLKFSEKYLKDFTSIHILPFFPSTSDRGFAIKDFTRVDKKFGNWKQINKLSKNHKLMFDGVINHTSSKHRWFQKALQGNEKFKQYYNSYDSLIDTSKVFRPRSKPLLTKFNKYYWTTFSKDQIDLNFNNPEVFQEIINIFKLYIKRGAKYIRLDAIAYLFDDPTGPSIDLYKNHIFIKEIKKIMPKDLKFIVEVNLEEEHIDRYRQNLTYNFPLSPLVYYSFLKKDPTILIKFLKKDKSNNFNFLASHDGIGLIPAKNYLNNSKIAELVEDVEKKGFVVSSGINPKTKKKEPYELNINYFDAMDRDERKMLCAHSILLATKGIPAIYFHSLLGSYGEQKFSEKYPRELNRKNIDFKKLELELSKNTIRKKIYEGILKMIKIKSKFNAFHPNSSQEVRKKNGLLMIKRVSKYKNKKNIICLHNFSSKKVKIKNIFDLITETNKNYISPFGYVWFEELT